MKLGFVCSEVMQLALRYRLSQYPNAEIFLIYCCCGPAAGMPSQSIKQLLRGGGCTLRPLALCNRPFD